MTDEERAGRDGCQTGDKNSTLGIQWRAIAQSGTLGNGNPTWYRFRQKYYVLLLALRVPAVKRGKDRLMVAEKDGGLTRVGSGAWRMPVRVA